MFDIPVFAQERSDGLEQLVKGTHSLALSCQLTLTEQFPVCLKNLAKATNLGQEDLHYLRSVPVTAGWEVDPKRMVPAGMNLNDDFFDPVEVWVARHTPEDKPVNEEHDCAQIIGQITSNLVVDGDGHLVSEETSADELPAKYHVVTGAVLYKVWDKPELQEKVDAILAEIADGKRCVSMECLFRGFDYVVVDADGSARAVARSKESAFLTKHLRAYGGDGTYQGKRVGRLLRNLLFSGKGIVKKPANPESVILSSASIFEKLSAKEITSGYVTVSDEVSQENGMTVELETLQKQLAEAKTEIDRLKAELHETNVKEITQAREHAETELALKVKQLDEVTKAYESVQVKLADTEKTLKSTSDELTVLKSDKLRADRIKFVMGELAADETKAVEFIDSLKGLTLSDEQFASHLLAMKKWVTNNPQPGNTSFPHGTAQQPPKATPAPEAPKVTNLPSKGSENDPAEVNADPAVIDEAKPQVEPSLAAVNDAGAETVRMAIAGMFGWKAETEEN